MSEQYVFKGGIKDGSPVPDVFWILDVIDVHQHLVDGKMMVYSYALNEDDRCWYLMETKLEDEEEEHD